MLCRLLVTVLVVTVLVVAVLVVLVVVLTNLAFEHWRRYGSSIVVVGAVVVIVTG